MAQIRTTELINLLRRLAVALDAGVDIVTLLKQEAQRGSSAQRQHMQIILENVADGETLAEGFRDCGSYFPNLVYDMVEVGEKTGHLGAVLTQVRQYYENMLSLRRSFISGLTMPALQLLAALFIVGILIWICGMLGSGLGGEPIDLLGFGLVGTSGLIKYVIIICSIALAIYLLYQALASGQFGGTLMPVIIRTPVLGNCIQSFALARFAWTLGLALESGADARHSMRMALRSTQNTYYTQFEQQADEDILEGHELHLIIEDTGVFPDEFVTALAAAEISGTHGSSLEHLSKEYDRKARNAASMLTMFANGAIWASVAAFIIFLIFRLAMFYIGQINAALEGL